MADRQLTLAYLGNGKGANRYHIPFAMALPELFRVKWIQARHVDHSAWAAWPGVAYTTSLEEVLRDPEVDIVEVVTPAPTHYELARRVLASGKHCVVDKPFCASADEAEELFALAELQGVSLQCYQNRRLDGEIQTARQLMEEGRLGDVYEAVVAFDGYWPTMPNPAPYDPINGAVYGLGCHEVDQLIYLFGLPEGYAADVRQFLGQGESDDYYDIDLLYGSRNLKASAKGCNFMAQPRPSIALWGTKGSYVKETKDAQERDLKRFYLPAGHPDFGLERPRDWGTLVTYDDEGRYHEERLETVRSSYCGFYEALYETVANGAPPFVKPEETLCQMLILEEATRGLA